MTGPVDSGPREWDAETYQRISVPHEEWAEAVLARLPLEGGETVLDAGCGTGRVTRMLVERLPTGRVIAVDGSAAMIEKVREVLRPGDTALVADLIQLEPPEPVDAIVSSAVFHWIHDHEALFQRLRGCVKRGGRLVAQCGGAGNIERFRETAARVAAEEPFSAQLGSFAAPWHYATAADTERRLREAGFGQVRAWLEPWEVVPPEPFAYLQSICTGPYLDELPERLHAPFVEAVLAAEPEPFSLSHVRLNIDAVAA